MNFPRGLTIYFFCYEIFNLSITSTCIHYSAPCSGIFSTYNATVCIDLWCKSRVCFKNYLSESDLLKKVDAVNHLS